MKSKPLNQGEFLSALDFVKTDIDNLRAYFEQGVIQPTSAVVEKALKLRVSIEMFVALFGSATASTATVSSMIDEITMQNKVIARQNAELLEEVQKGREPIQATILNEVLNVKELLLKSTQRSSLAPSEEISQMKSELFASLKDLEIRIANNIEYSQKTQLQEYSQRMLSEMSYMQRPTSQSGTTCELLGEIAEFREECTKQIAQVEKNIIDSIEQSKDELMYSQKSDEILKSSKDIKVDVEKSIVFAQTSMQVLRAISKQLIGIYQAEKRALADIEKAIAGVSYKPATQSSEEMELSEGFAQLKEELQSISSIINFGELEKIQDPNQAIQMVDNYANEQFEPEGLLQTAKDLQSLAAELSELEKNQQASETAEVPTVAKQLEEELAEIDKQHEKARESDDSEEIDELLNQLEAEEALLETEELLDEEE